MEPHARPWVKNTLTFAMIMMAFLPFCVALYGFEAYFFMRVVAGNELLIWLLFTLVAYATGFSISKAWNFSWETRLLWGVMLAIFIAGVFLVDQKILEPPLTLVLLTAAPLVFHLAQIKSADYAEHILRCFVAVYALYCAAFLFVFVTGLFTPPFFPKTQGVFPGFNNIRHVAPPLGAAIIIGTFLYTFQNLERGRRMPVIQFIALSLLWSVFLFSGTRGGLLCILLAFVLVAVVCQTHWRSVVPVFIAPMLIGSAAAVYLPFVVQFKGTFLGLLRIFFRFTNAQSADGFSSGRLSIWRAGIQSTNDSPWIGHGLGNYDLTQIYLEKSTSTAHNIVIEYIHALGYIGGFCLIVWIFVKWGKAARSIHQSTNSVFVGAFAGLTFLLLYSNLNGLSARYLPILILAILFPIVIARTQLNRDL